MNAREAAWGRDRLARIALDSHVANPLVTPSDSVRFSMVARLMRSKPTASDEGNVIALPDGKVMCRACRRKGKGFRSIKHHYACVLLNTKIQRRRRRGKPNAR